MCLEVDGRIASEWAANRKLAPGRVVGISDTWQQARDMASTRPASRLYIHLNYIGKEKPTNRY